MAAGLAALGQEVLLLDLDPAGGATRWLGVDADDDTGLADALVNRTDLCPLVTPHISLIQNWFEELKAKAPPGP